MIFGAKRRGKWRYLITVGGGIPSDRHVEKWVAQFPRPRPHTFPQLKVEASITDKVREFASCLGGVIVGNCVSCKEHHILIRMPKIY